MNIQCILADIHALEQELLAFERKYGVRSETFFAAYMSGEEPEDDRWTLDFGEWASIYKTWLLRQSEYRNAIQRNPKNASQKAELIDKLPSTLDKPDKETDELWAIEAENRIDAYDRGKIKTVPLAKVLEKYK